MKRMKILFWQNINSMHQSAFLKALAAWHDVILIVTRRGSGREDMGWFEPELPGIVLLQWSEIDWKSLIRQHSGKDAIHVFAGLHAFHPVHQAFIFAHRHGCRIGVYAEPLVMRGVAGLVKQWRGRIDARRFSDSLDFVLCIGKESKRQYLDWGFPEHKLHDWAYVTEPADGLIPLQSGNRPFRILFPASCTSRKGADLLIDAVLSIHTDIQFVLICHALPPHGADAFQKRLIEQTRGIDHIHLLPYIDNLQLKTSMCTADLVVLPSRFDGWGAVINESLGAGTPVLVSDRCGSAALIENNQMLGTIFGPPTIDALRSALTRVILEGFPTNDRRVKIRHWAEQCISGVALATHFIRILNATASGSRDRTIPPWSGESRQVAPFPLTSRD